MKRIHSLSLVFAGLPLLAACSSSSSSPPATPDDSGTTTDSVVPINDSAIDETTPTDSSAPPDTNVDAPSDAPSDTPSETGPTAGALDFKPVCGGASLPEPSGTSVAPYALQVINFDGRIFAIAQTIGATGADSRVHECTSGSTWTPMPKGIVAPPTKLVVHNGKLYAFAYGGSPTTDAPQAVLAAGSSTWTGVRSLPTGIFGTYPVFIDENDSTRGFYAFTYDARIRKSTDDGMTWPAVGVSADSDPDHAHWSGAQFSLGTKDKTFIIRGGSSPAPFSVTEDEGKTWDFKRGPSAGISVQAWMPKPDGSKIVMLGQSAGAKSWYISTDDAKTFTKTGPSVDAATGFLWAGSHLLSLTTFLDPPKFSDNDGLTWSPFTIATGSPKIQSFAGYDGGKLYGVTYSAAGKTITVAADLK